MTVEALTALNAATAATIQEVPGVAVSPTGAFETILAGLQDLNSHLLAGEQHVAQLALGKTENLHEALLASEQTRLSFELMLSVRNKVLEAYQELMRMQV